MINTYLFVNPQPLGCSSYQQIGQLFCQIEV